MSEQLLVIAGPTASGKTAFAISAAQRLGAEIINADSQQVYRHFDIGTAKPTAQQLAAVPHHLISFVDPLDRYSAARFQRDADAAIAEVKGRGRKVVLVGGTGLYLRVLLHGVMAGSSADLPFRAELEARAAEQGRPALHSELARVDPKSADRIKPTDLVRIVRALEIFHQTGTPASDVREAHGFAGLRHPYRMIVLMPEREALYARINARTQAMYDAGLYDETRALVERGLRSAAPMGSVGYAQALQLLDGEIDVARAIELTAQATRKYAKRQLTWFKKEQGADFAAPPYDALLESLPG